MERGISNLASLYNLNVEDILLCVFQQKGYHHQTNSRIQAENSAWQVLTAWHGGVMAVLEWHGSHFGAAMLKILTAGKEE